MPTFGCEILVSQEYPETDMSVELVCQTCGEPLEARGGRFCHACGAEIGGPDPAEQAQAEQEEKPRPWFRLVVLVWLLIMIGALYFMYSRAFVVGSS